MTTTAIRPFVAPVIPLPDQLCQSCRRRPATHEVWFADKVFDVCAECAEPAREVAA